MWLYVTMHEIWFYHFTPELKLTLAEWNTIDDFLFDLIFNTKLIYFQNARSIESRVMKTFWLLSHLQTRGKWFHLEEVRELLLPHSPLDLILNDILLFLGLKRKLIGKKLSENELILNNFCHSQISGEYSLESTLVRMEPIFNM